MGADLSAMIDQQYRRKQKRDEEDQIVAFLKTLSDGHTTPLRHRDVYAGECRTGGSAKTQGNETLIATPALPPCAAEVCGVQPVPQPPIP